MKKKIKVKLQFPFKFSYDAPVTLSFVLLSIVLFLINHLALNNNLDFYALSSTTKNGGLVPFDLKSAFSYLKTVFYIFGSENWTIMFANLLFILLLGPKIEEYYGSIIIGLMMLVSGLFTGVLNACFCTLPLWGPVSIVFMLIFLNAFISFSKKQIPFSFFAAFILYIFYQIFTMLQTGSVKTPVVINETLENAEEALKALENSIVSYTKAEIALKIVICVAGGLCGGLFAFLASPKTKTARKSKSTERKTAKSREELAEEIDKESPRFKKQKKTEDEDEATVVGTIKFD